MSKTKTKTQDRLKKRSDFLRLNKGHKWVSPTVIVQIDKGLGERIRLGLTATKKTGNAVARNRIKRRLREAAKIVLADHKDRSDIVLIGRAETATCPFATLIKDLRWCLKKLEAAGAHQTS